MRSFDIIGLQETWSEDQNDFKGWLSGYTVRTKEGSRRSKHGHCSGGIAVFFKDSIFQGISEINSTFNHALSFVLKASYFGLNTDIILICSYLPPEGSFVYNTGTDDNYDGISLLQEEICNITSV